MFMPLKQDFISRISKRGLIAETPVERLLLREYGSMFVAEGVTHPPFVVFPDERSVTAFQLKSPTSTAIIGGLEFVLQARAADALTDASEEATRLGRTILPRGPDSGSRNYSDTVGLWASRVEPAIDHWIAQGSITPEAAKNIRSLSPFEQVPVVLELEEQGIYFAKDLSKSIIYSVAPPGTSQHLAMLAFDVTEFDEPEVRSILARNGWFQTVTSDLPHFTYLGVDETELPSLGLKRVENAGRFFWVPEI